MPIDANRLFSVTVVLTRPSLWDNSILPSVTASSQPLPGDTRNTMTGILAIDAATDACSVAVYRDGEYQQHFECTPRQHSQRLFGMLRELLPSGKLRDHGIGAIAYGCGPGSFTGLRIATSAAQGLAYTSGLPAVAVSTLACQAQSALRLGTVSADSIVLSMLDARINEVYYALYRFEQGLAFLLEGPYARAPADVTVDCGAVMLQAVGSGCDFIDSLSPGLRQRLASVSPQTLPAARDLVPLALEKISRGDIQQAQQVQPVYVRDEISWKKLAEQGKS
jgi:tRNA threonylcarbamoyladenosine biosynthesis protein TsaB